MTLLLSLDVPAELGVEPLAIGLAALVALTTTGAAGAYAWQSALRRRLLLAAAEHLGGRLVRGNLFGPELVLGLGGADMHVRRRGVGLRGTDKLQLEVEAACRCEVLPRAVLPPAKNRLRTGDAAFDGLFVVREAPSARVLLTPRVRRALVELCGPRRTTLLRLTADGQRLVMERSRPLTKPAEVIAWVEGARPVFERYLELARAARSGL